jgi:hypothetical protein
MSVILSCLYHQNPKPAVTIMRKPIGCRHEGST